MTVETPDYLVKLIKLADEVKDFLFEETENNVKDVLTILTMLTGELAAEHEEDISKVEQALQLSYTQSIEDETAAKTRLTLVN